MKSCCIAVLLGAGLIWAAGSASAQDNQTAGDQFFREGRWADAISAYSHAIRANPRNPYLFNQRARAYAGQKNWSAAVTDFTTARMFDPNNPTIRDNLHGALIDKGVALAREGSHIWAVNDFSMAIDLREDKRDGWFFRGISRAELGELKDAIEDLRQALALDSGNKQTRLYFGKILHRNAVKLLNAGKYDETVANMFEAIAVDGSHPEFHLVRGVAYHRLNRPADAVADLRAVLKHDPKHTAARRELGEILTAQARDLRAAQQWPDAIKAYDELIDSDAGNPDHWDGRGITWYAMFRTDGTLTHLLNALDDFERALTLNPEFAAYREHATTARAGVEYVFYDEFAEDRAAPAEPWQLDLNGIGSPDLYAVRGGRLVLQSFEPADLAKRAGQPFFLLDHPLPETEDYLITGEIQLAATTGTERFAFGVYKDPENHVLGTVGFAHRTGNSPQTVTHLQAWRLLSGQRVSLKERDLPAGTAPAAAQGTLRFRLLKRGFSYVVTVRLKGTDRWEALEPIEELHPGGRLVLGFFQAAEAPTEMSTIYLNWIRILKVK